jgi:hypothetical protein
VRSRVALFLVLIFAGFVLGAAWDRCAEEEGECGALCHAGCLDSCATAPVPRIETGVEASREAGAARILAASSPFGRSESPDYQPPRA